MIRCFCVFISVLALASGADQELDEDRRIAETNNWIYDDISRGFETARETGKPLFVVIRCPP